MKFHKTKDGKKIKLADLETSHLENILKWIERKAKEGLIVRIGGGSCAEDMWHDEETLYGDEVKSQLNFSDYKSELERRASLAHNGIGLGEGGLVGCSILAECVCPLLPNPCYTLARLIKR